MIKQKSQNEKAAWKRYLPPVSIFLGSRLLVAVAVIQAIEFLPKEANHLNAWDANSTWYRYLLRYDAGWYYAIAQGGYAYNGDDSVPQTPGFYPLYPLLTKLVSMLGIPTGLALLLVSNVAILAAIVLFYKFVKQDFGERVALYAVALLSFFPTSVFFSAGYTESLAFVLIITFFLLLRERHYYLASCVAGLVSGTRATGLILLAPLLVELWRDFPLNNRRALLRWGVCSVLAVSGLSLFMLYQWIALGTPLAFVRNQHAWEVGGLSSNFLSAFTLRPFYEHLGDIARGPYPNSLDPWIFLALIALLLIFRKRIATSLWCYALGVLLLPYLTRSGGHLGFQAMMRYMLLAFPVFIILGTLCKERLWLGLILTAMSAGFLFMYAAMFAQWYWIG